jgi:hypothetical protein
MAGADAGVVVVGEKSYAEGSATARCRAWTQTRWT